MAFCEKDERTSDASEVSSTGNATRRRGEGKRERTVLLSSSIWTSSSSVVGVDFKALTSGKDEEERGTRRTQSALELVHPKEGKGRKAKEV